MASSGGIMGMLKRYGKSRVQRTKDKYTGREGGIAGAIKSTRDSSGSSDNADGYGSSQDDLTSGRSSRRRSGKSRD